MTTFELKFLPPPPSPCPGGSVADDSAVTELGSLPPGQPQPLSSPQPRKTEAGQAKLGGLCTASGTHSTRHKAKAAAQHSNW